MFSCRSIGDVDCNLFTWFSCSCTMYAILSIPFYPCLSLSIPVYPCLSQSIPVYPCLSLSIPVYPFLSLSIPFYPFLSLSIVSHCNHCIVDGEEPLEWDEEGLLRCAYHCAAGQYSLATLTLF